MQKKIIAAPYYQTEVPKSTFSTVEILYCLYSQKIPYDFTVKLSHEIKTLIVKAIHEIKSVTQDRIKLSSIANTFLTTAAMSASYALLQELISFIATHNKLMDASQIINALFSATPQESPHEKNS